MHAIHFGAGNIGRGVIGAILFEAGYDITFVDINKEIVDDINKNRKYTILVKDHKCSEQIINNVSAIHSSSLQIYEKIANSSIVTTSIGEAALSDAAKTIANAIKLRHKNKLFNPLNIIACENTAYASGKLKEYVYSYLSKSQQLYCDKYIGFPNCVVDRVVTNRRDDSLDVIAEQYYEWHIEDTFVGNIPITLKTYVVKDISKYIERKLFTLNTGHAVAAYFGKLRGKTTIAECMSDEEIYNIVKSSMIESSHWLIAKYEFYKIEHYEYIDKILKRFRNPLIEDKIDRVCRDPIRKLSNFDRLIRPAIELYNLGIEPTNIIIGIAAAFHYNNDNDTQSIELQNRIKSCGLYDTIMDVTGIQDDAIINRIVDVYNLLNQKYFRK